MRKTITKKWLSSIDACEEGVQWWFEEANKEKDSIKVLKKLIKNKHLGWANWLIVRVMTYKQYVAYSIYAAEQVIDIFEEKYPKDKRPREAISAAKRCLKNPSKKNKHASASAAAYAAEAAEAAYAAYAAEAAEAAEAAAQAAYGAEAAEAAEAAYAAYAAAKAAAQAAEAAEAAAEAAAQAADRNKMRIKILKYGLRLLEVAI